MTQEKVLTGPSAIDMREERTAQGKSLATDLAGCGRAPNHPWFVVHTHYRQESIAARELAENGYPHYLPMQATQRRIKGVLTPLHLPMFSMYCFCQVLPGQSAANVRYLPGVRNLFSTPSLKPIPLPGGFVERLITEAPRRLHLTVDALPCLDKGTKVRATDGPLTGLDGVVLACDGLMTQVDMMMFGRPCPVELRRVDLDVVV